MVRCYSVEDHDGKAEVPIGKGERSKQLKEEKERGEPGLVCVENS
jgi:hypothetical protein